MLIWELHVIISDHGNYISIRNETSMHCSAREGVIVANVILLQ